MKKTLISAGCLATAGLLLTACSSTSTHTSTTSTSSATPTVTTCSPDAKITVSSLDDIKPTHRDTMRIYDIAPAITSPVLIQNMSITKDKNVSTNEGTKSLSFESMRVDAESSVEYVPAEKSSVDPPVINMYTSCTTSKNRIDLPMGSYKAHYLIMVTPKNGTITPETIYVHIGSDKNRVTQELHIK